MKRFNQLMSLLLFAAVTQYSCINDADVAFSDEIPTESNGNLALSFEIPNVALTRSAESSGLTEVGSKEEYAVKSLTVYLFDSTTKTFKDQQELKNISLTGMDGQKIQYTADKITVNPGTYNIFAIANGRTLNIYHVAMYAGNARVVEKGGQPINYNNLGHVVGIGRVVN